MVGNGNADRAVSYGVDVNVLPGDLITHESISPTGSIPASVRSITPTNDRYGNYNGVFFDSERTLLARIPRRFLHPFQFQG